MDGIFDENMDSHLGDIMLSDSIGYLLGKIINSSFKPTTQQPLHGRRGHWESLRSALDDWKRNMMAGTADYSPFSIAAVRGNPFLSIWMLQPFQSKCILGRSTLTHPYSLIVHSSRTTILRNRGNDAQLASSRFWARRTE